MFIIHVFVIILVFFFILQCSLLLYIGPIGAAASRPSTRSHPGEFHVIAHLRLVLLVFNSSLHDVKVKSIFIFILT